jgi:hypothetical protein
MIELVELSPSSVYIYTEEMNHQEYFVGTRYIDAGSMSRLKIIATFSEEFDAQFFIQHRAPSDSGWKVYKRK